MHRIMQWLIVRHFTASIPTLMYRMLQRHMQQCPDCLHFYERHLEWEALLPDSQQHMGARMWRQVQAQATAPRTRTWTWNAALLGAAAAAAIVLLMLRMPPQPAEFGARGTATALLSKIAVLAKEPQQAHFIEVDRRVAAQAELAFRMYNDEHFKYLLLVVEDAAEHIFYLYPAHAGQGGLDLSQHRSGATLPDAFAPVLAVGLARVIAVFSDASIRVDDLEQALQAGALDALAAKYAPRVQVQTIDLQIEPAQPANGDGTEP